MYLKNSKKIVIKIGSSLLVDQDKKIRKKWLSSFAKDIKKLRSNNQKIIIVSSGAIALGCKKMNYNKKNLKLDKSQAIASIGQIELMNLFLETFSKYKLDISQILLTLTTLRREEDQLMQKELLKTYSILISSLLLMKMILLQHLKLNMEIMIDLLLE